MGFNSPHLSLKKNEIVGWLWVGNVPEVGFSKSVGDDIATACYDMVANIGKSLLKLFNVLCCL